MKLLSVRNASGVAGLLCVWGLAVCGPALAGGSGCSEAGLVVGRTKISATSGGFGGDLDPSDLFGRSVANVGDLDGDGVSDLAVGASSDDDGGPERGAVWILFMNANGSVRSSQKISSSSGGFAGVLDNGDFFGESLASIGDLDGDGIPDLAVGAFADDDGGNNRGAIYILFLNTNGTVRNHQKISSTVGGFVGPLDASDLFGSSLTSLGDLDGDGVIDLAVGAEFDDDGGADRGAVYVLFMNANGTVRAEQKISSVVGGLTGTVDHGDFFGASVAALGDLDGDGTKDLVVGATGDDDGGAERGAVYVLFLNGNGSVRGQQKISVVTGGFFGLLDNNDFFGESIASLGDLDLDGIADLAVGAIGDDDGGGNRGALYVLFMNASGTVRAQQKISSTLGGFAGPLDDGDFFGHSLASIGDLDGDGFREIAAGALLDDDGGSEQGAVWILELDDCDAPPSIVQDIAPSCVLLPAVGGSTGFSISATGDGTLSYQWRRDGVALMNGGPIAGADSAALTIFATQESVGLYDCVVTNAFGSATSSAAILGVRPSPFCAGDADGNGVINFTDITSVLANFNAMCP